MFPQIIPEYGILQEFYTITITIFYILFYILCIMCIPVFLFRLIEYKNTRLLIFISIHSTVCV